MSRTLTFVAYNTHLFGGLGDIADVKTYYDALKGSIAPLYTFNDDDRKDALERWLASLPNAPDIISLEEVWWKDYVEHIKSYLKDKYPVGYDHADSGIDVLGHKVLSETNTAGLLLLAGKDFKVLGTGNESGEYHFGYISNLKSVPDDTGKNTSASWSSQDTIPTTDKGYRGLHLQFQLDGNNADLGVFNTHMPTSAHSHKPSVRACFAALASAVAGFRKNYPDAPVIVLADLNLSELPPGSSSNPNAPEDLYSEWVANTQGTALFQQAGLLDLYRAVASDASSCPGYTTGPPNYCWEYFNPKWKDDGTMSNNYRIDYFFLADSSSGKIKFDRSSLRMQVLNGGEMPACGSESDSGNSAATYVDKDKKTSVPMSDHWPIWGQASVYRS